MRPPHFALVVCTGTLVLLFTAYSQSPAPVAVSEAPDRPSGERVRIEYQLVRIPVTRAVEPPVTVVSHRPVARERRPQTTVAVSRPEQPRPLLQRAVRGIVGNGRYTPQPFPRPR